LPNVDPHRQPGAAVKRLWIVGGGGAALEAWAVAQALGSPLGGFITLDGSVPFSLEEGLACRLEREFLATARPGEDGVVLAVGDPGLRARLAGIFHGKGFRSQSLIHPRAVIGPRVDIGEGTLVMAGAVLETHLSLGRNCLVNVLVSVGHGCRVGDFCNLGPGVNLPGDVALGDRSDLGTGCAFRPGVTLGPDMIIGAGAVVTHDWPGGLTLVGVPAVPIRRRDLS